MRITAKTSKSLSVRYIPKNIEFSFRQDRQTTYTFINDDVYKFVLATLRDYEKKGIVTISYPRESAPKTQESAEVSKPKSKAKSNKKEA